MLELINPYVAKILIAAKDRDSVRQISMKIRESYGWTYKWVSELEKLGILRRDKQEVFVNKSNDFYRSTLKICTNLLKSNLSLSDAYLWPNLIGMEYKFTSTDAVFVWTKGGYNIGRSMESYPIFIEILEKDKIAWQKYFDQFWISYVFKNERKKGIYFVISTADNIEKEYCEGIPVLPLAKTVEWAKKYSFNFEPALEMLDQLYDLKIGVKYAGA